jgi:hypothetical protein
MFAFIDLKPVLKKEFCFFGCRAQFRMSIVVDYSHGGAGQAL